MRKDLAINKTQR